MKRSLFLISFLIVINFFRINAQIKDVASMLSGASGDAQKLFQAYLKPYANAFGADLNGGWYNTAKTHKLGGFDLTFSVSASFVPSSDKTYDASKLGLTGAVSNGTIAQTVAGEKKTGPTIAYYQSYNGTNVKISQYNTPKGTGWGIIPSPMLQLGIGLIKSTDITVRYLPSMSVGDLGSAQMWGIGLKHSIKQYIPGIKMAPFFHLSVFGGYTQMKTSVDMSFQQSFYINALDPDPVIEAVHQFNNQNMQMTVKGLTGNVLASFDFPVISIYAGAGFSNTKTNLKIAGDFPTATVATSGTNTGKIVLNDAGIIKDPLNIEIKSMDGSKTKPRLNGGVKFKFAIITLHFDYTYANYSVATAGLGISFR